MSQVWYQWNRVWIYVALLVPLAVAAILLITWLRPSHDRKRSISEVGMFFGTLPWVWMILTPMKLEPNARTVYLIPFADLKAQFSLGVAQYALVQVGGNLMVLFAFGFFARLRFPSVAKPLPLLIFGWLFALTLELLQHAFTGGRVFSVDDVLLNGIGCALGGLATPLLVSTRRY
jgi:glycopeptide antibiotics resistance protein